MGKISNLPDDERLAIIGYLAQDGVVDVITAEVPIRRSDEFQKKYGIKPYIIKSDKKYSDQYRIYLTDPEGAPQVLKDALDTKYQRLNDSEFVRELVDNYGFRFFEKTSSQVILEHAKKLDSDDYDAFMGGFNSNSDFISALQTAVHEDNLPEPTISAVPEKDKSKKKKGRSKPIADSNGSFTREQLLYLGWAGEEYLYKYLTSGDEKAFVPFKIDAKKVKDVIWYNEGYDEDDDWTDQSVGKGCDILIKTEDAEYLVEVKSSKRKSPIFGMTAFEMQKMKENRQNYYLAKIDYLENLISGAAPNLRVFGDPYDRFFDPEKMMRALFYCE